MNSKVEQVEQGGALDIAKLALAGLLAGAGLWAYYGFPQWPGALRALAVLGGLVAGFGVFMLSVRGRQVRGFASEAMFELRKVVWPTGQENLRITGAIMLMVVIVSMILAAFDFGISWLIKLLLGN
jgi:preprotein translocase subunit SecE